MAEYFLKLDGIPGESRDAKHKDEIDVLAFSWGVSQTGTGATGGGSGKAAFDDLLLVAHTSKASPHIWLACANGTHIKSAVLTCRRKGKAPVEFLTIELSEVVVSSYEVDGSDEEPPLDQFTLAYGKVETSYTPVDKTGTPQPPIVTGWDVRSSKGI